MNLFVAGYFILSSWRWRPFYDLFVSLLPPLELLLIQHVKELFFYIDHLSVFDLLHC